jgi:hypothetical protein
MEGYIARLLWALVQLGVIPPEAANDPVGPGLASADFQRISATLAALGYAGNR